VEDSQFGERCPACLGQTLSVIQRPLQREAIQEIYLPRTNAHLYVLLDNIRSALNVGSIFRSADGFEFDHIYLCGITPTPDFGDVSKSAVGAEEYVHWTSHKNAVDLIVNLKVQGYTIWALERTKNSIALNSAIGTGQKPKHLVLVVGNEVTGIDPGIQKAADSIVHLPMRGQKHSFNVAVAFAIASQMIRSWIN
jgi:23S rRNA (guanosine2251-2'-O)-methyltransferase